MCRTAAAHRPWPTRWAGRRNCSSPPARKASNTSRPASGACWPPTRANHTRCCRTWRRWVAVTGCERSSLLLDVPTVGETVPGYEMSVWYGAFGPAGMPPTIVARLNAEINRILFLPDVKKKMEDIAVEVAKMTPEELGTLTH